MGGKTSHIKHPYANMETLNSSTTLLPAKDERTWAAIAHAPLLGLVTPLLIWLFYHRTSRYIAFQAFQAALIQLVMAALLLPGVLSFVAGLAAVATPGPSVHVEMLLIAVVALLLVCLLELALTVYGVIGAVQAYQGKDFRYAVIGWLSERCLH